MMKRASGKTSLLSLGFKRHEKELKGTALVLMALIVMVVMWMVTIEVMTRELNMILKKLSQSAQVTVVSRTARDQISVANFPSKFVLICSFYLLHVDYHSLLPSIHIVMIYLL